jgi:inner membrane transporter RhtA
LATIDRDRLERSREDRGVTEQTITGAPGVLPQEIGPAPVLAGGLMCLLAMTSIQFGAALSSSAILAYGPVGATWLRLGFAAIILVVIVRPPIHRFSSAQWRTALLLGLVTAAMTVCFFSAIRHLPLGLAVAIDFLGPLCVAGFAYGLGWRLAWPALAAVGVLFLSHDGEAWTGNLPGVLYALGSAIGWAGYIVLTKRAGATFAGFQGLAMSLLVAAIVITPFAIGSGLPALTPAGMAEMAFLALLVPLLPYLLEMAALRKMPTSTFGILMSLEPAIGALAGFWVLSQPMTLLQMAGSGLVVAASAGATSLGK